MERKQRSLLGKDVSDQYLADLEGQIAQVCNVRNICKFNIDFMVLFMISDAWQQVK